MLYLSEGLQALFLRTVPILCVVPAQSYAQSLELPLPIDEICANPSASPGLHAQFTASSLALIEGGADKEEVLDALECIARVDPGWIGSAAVRALFHCADQDDEIQARLLRIITDEQTKSGIRSAAASILALDAGEPSRTALLEFVTDKSDTQDTRAAENVLMDTGDPRYLQFLEETIKRLPANSRRRAVYALSIRQMRFAAKPLPQLLEHLASPEGGTDRRWILLQAARKGASKDELRDAAVKYLRLPNELKRGQDRSGLVGTGLKLGIFTAADDKEFAVVRRIRGLRFSDEGSIAPWATRHVTRARDVYGFVDTD